MPELTAWTREDARGIGDTETALRKSAHISRFVASPMVSGASTNPPPPDRDADSARSLLASSVGADGTPVPG